MRFKKKFFIEGILIILAVLSLFWMAENVGAQPSAGQPDNDPYVPAGITQPYYGPAVPASYLPTGFPGPEGYYTLVGTDHCGVPGNQWCYGWGWYENGVLMEVYNGLWSCIPYACDYYLCWNGSDPQTESCTDYRYWPVSGPPPGNGKQSCNSNRSVGDPVDVATGNKYEEVLDLSVSTPGIPLEFRRSYNSNGALNGPLGYGWTHNYNVKITTFLTTPIMRVIVWDTDGRPLYYSQDQRTYSDGMHFVPDSGITKDRLRQDSTTNNYILRRKENNLTYTFSSSGQLQTISDPNGNTLTMTYNGANLTQVSNNFGKTLSFQNNHTQVLFHRPCGKQRGC